MKVLWCKTSRVTLRVYLVTYMVQMTVSFSHPNSLVFPYSNLHIKLCVGAGHERRLADEELSTLPGV